MVLDKNCESYNDVRDTLLEIIPDYDEYFVAIEDAGTMFIVFGTLMWQRLGRLFPHGDSMRFIFSKPVQGVPRETYLAVTWGTGISKTIFGREIIRLEIEFIDR